MPNQGNDAGNLPQFRQPADIHVQIAEQENKIFFASRFRIPKLRTLENTSSAQLSSSPACFREPRLGSVGAP